MGKILSFHRPFPRYTDLGCYPLAYILDTKWSGMVTVCAACATRERDESNALPSEERTIEAITPTVLWEGPTEACEDCGADLETAYGDPDSEIHGEVPASYLSHERE